MTEQDERMKTSCDGCEFLHQVIAFPGGYSSNGLGCLYTGGHAEKRCSRYSVKEVK